MAAGARDSRRSPATSPQHRPAAPGGEPARRRDRSAPAPPSTLPDEVRHGVHEALPLPDEEEEVATLEGLELRPGDAAVQFLPQSERCRPVAAPVEHDR